MRSILLALLVSVSFVCNASVPKISDLRHRDDVDNLIKMGEALLPEAHFDIAYLNYSLATLYMSQSMNELALQSVDAGLNALSKDASAKDSADAMALWAATLGLKMSLNPMSAMHLGPQNERVIQRAMGLGSENPTVWLVRGIGLSYTPKAYGGGDDKALDALNKSVGLFEAKTPADTQWGHADAYVWRSRLYKKVGENKKAKADLESALRIAPDYVLPRQLLKKE